MKTKRVIDPKHAINQKTTLLTQRHLLATLRAWHTLVLGTAIHHGSGASTDRSHGTGPRANGLTMDSAGHTVVELDVEFRENIVIDDARLVKITKRGLVHNVAYRETLDRLILRRLGAASVANNLMRVVAPVAITSVIAAFHSHFWLLQRNRLRERGGDTDLYAARRPSMCNSVATALHVDGRRVLKLL